MTSSVINEMERFKTLADSENIQVNYSQADGTIRLYMYCRETHCSKTFKLSYNPVFPGIISWMSMVPYQGDNDTTVQLIRQLEGQLCEYKVVRESDINDSQTQKYKNLHWLVRDMIHIMYQNKSTSPLYDIFSQITSWEDIATILREHSDYQTEIRENGDLTLNFNGERYIFIRKK